MRAVADAHDKLPPRRLPPPPRVRDNTSAGYAARGAVRRPLRTLCYVSDEATAVDTDRQSTPDQWLLPVYRVPSEPTRLRAAVWRRLNSLGAVYLQNSAAVLPAGKTAEHALRRLRRETSTWRAAGGWRRTPPASTLRTATAPDPAAGALERAEPPADQDLRAARQMLVGRRTTSAARTTHQTLALP